jgi:hypothetical protein
MKLICLALVTLGVCSCNTTIGIGRDIKEGFIWSKNKIQENRQQRQQDSYQDHSGAPVY